MTVHKVARQHSKTVSQHKHKAHDADSHTPASGQVDANPQQSFAKPTFGNITPTAVQALQRTYGNQYVLRMVQRSRTEKAVSPPTPSSQFSTENTLQRTVSSKQIMTPDKLLNYFKTNNAQNYQDALAANMDDAALKIEFDRFIKSNDLYTMSEVAQIVCRIIEHQAAGNPVNQQNQVGNVQVTITQLNANLPSGLNIGVAGNKYDYHSNRAAFEASLLIEGPPTEVSEWQIGFVQTIFEGERRLIYTNTKGELHEYRIWMPTPIRDSAAGYAGPWNNSSAYSGFAAKSVSQVQVSMGDSPGFSWGANPGDAVQEVSGRDAFKTWLMMYKKDGSDVHFLRRWEWHVDYTGDAAKAGGLGGKLDQGPIVDTVGQGAIIGGPSAMDQIRSKPRQLTQAETQLRGGALLPDINAFEEMKKKAKQPNTPFSGMLPTKKYGSYVDQITSDIAKGDLEGAFGTLTALLVELNKMDTARKYWKNDIVKQEYFKPILDAVSELYLNITKQRSSATSGVG